MSAEARLRDEIDALREEVRQLRALLAPALDIPDRFQLTALERRLFSHLATRSIATFEALAAVISRDPRDDNTARVHIYKLRCKLSPHGISIKNVRGLGYEMTGWQAEKAVA